jgi:hypothetical protein
MENLGCLAMFVLFCLLLGFTIDVFTSDSEHKKYLDYGVKCTIEDKGVEITKGRHAYLTQLFLIRRIDDTTKYRVMSNIHDSIFYTKKIGDTLHYDYIRRDMFWTKK